MYSSLKNKMIYIRITFNKIFYGTLLQNNTRTLYNYMPQYLIIFNLHRLYYVCAFTDYSYCGNFTCKYILSYLNVVQCL